MGHRPKLPANPRMKPPKESQITLLHATFSIDETDQSLMTFIQPYSEPQKLILLACLIDTCLTKFLDMRLLLKIT